MTGWLLALAICHGADITTTQVALRNGARELNPLMPQQPAWNLVVGSAASAGQVWVFHRMGRSHPKLAKWATVAAIGVEGWAATANMRTIGQMRR